MTVMDILQEVLLTANVIGAGNLTPTDQQASVAMKCLTGLVDTSNADPLRGLTVQRKTFLLTPPDQSYTIGPDQSLDINAPRPQKILRANLADLSAAPNVPHYPMRVMQWHEYDASPLRATATPLPTALYYDRGFSEITNPTNPPENDLPMPGYGTIMILGLPTAANAVEFWASQPLTQHSNYFDDLIVPPGYYEYLLYGTCIRIYPRFGRAVDQTIAALYQDAKQVIEAANVIPAPAMPTDSGLPGSRSGGQWDGRSNSWIGRNG
jgi:hypothetical protein